MIKFCFWFFGFDSVYTHDRNNQDIQNNSFSVSYKKFQDCTVLIAKSDRLKTYYFWIAIKNFRWCYVPVSPRGRAYAVLFDIV